MNYSFFCETNGGDEAHIPAPDAAAAAELFVEGLVRNGDLCSGAAVYVRVMDYRGAAQRAHYFAVEYAMIPDATASSVDGAGLFADDAG